MRARILHGLLFCAAALTCELVVVASAPEAPAASGMNLLLNPGFQFHSFANSRRGEPQAWQSGSVPYWDQDAYGDCQVCRAGRVTEFRPSAAVDGIVRIRPGKRLAQFLVLAEAGLDPGDHISLSVSGYQSIPHALTVYAANMRVDSAEGQWSPAAFGMSESGSYDRRARGELIEDIAVQARSGDMTEFEVRLEGVVIGTSRAATHLLPDGDRSPTPATIGLQVAFRNESAQDVWIYAPCLCLGDRAQPRLPPGRPLSSLYRHIPRTMQKLWRGEPLHILHTGYSSDCGDANPPLYLYDEDPRSPTFKQPLQREFDGTRIGHPEWNDYVLNWNFHFMQWGRMRSALIRKFDYRIEDLLLNTMARGGSLLCEAHSGFAEFASLSLPPGRANGHHPGKSWAELHPRLFHRPAGPGPDLVSLGFGKKAAIGEQDELEQYEGAIRWFQRHYPGVEFVFSVNDWREEFAENAGSLRELSLRYGIPIVDFSRLVNRTRRHYDGRNPVPGDGHPQAYEHDLWFRQLERLFEAVDPIEPGFPQAWLPERISPHSLGWEGELRTYEAADPRLVAETMFVLDDVVGNIWATGTRGEMQVCVDGQPIDNPRIGPMSRRDSRNSTFAIGRLLLGDRHVIEISGPGTRLVAADSKVVVDRQWTGVESPRWGFAPETITAYDSPVGAPYGSRQVALDKGERARLEVVGTLFSLAYVEHPAGGTLRVKLDGQNVWQGATNVPFRLASGEERFVENRRRLGEVPFGIHRLEVEVVEGTVHLLGVYAYDTRSNRSGERVLRGLAAPGTTISFTPAFRARPLVHCTGGLTVAWTDVTPSEIAFRGSGEGSYEIVGQ